MRKIWWIRAMLIVFLTLFITGSVWAEENIIKFENGISYFDINKDGIKDIVVIGEYTTPFGGNIFKAYSFYLKKGRNGKNELLFYVPIERNKGSEAVIYTLSKIGGCGSNFNKEEITNISGLRIVNLGNETYLVYVNKTCNELEKLLNGICKFKTDIYKYDSEDQAFIKHRTTIINKLYCDAEEVFLHEAKYLLNLIKGGR